MSRISIGQHINHETGVVTELAKTKPDLVAGQSRAFGKLEIIEASTGEVKETFENIENVKKAVVDQLTALLAPVYNEYHGGALTNLNTARMYEIHLIDDPEELESQKYVPNEGKVVGYARLDGDYGGSDELRGSRNKSLSGYSIDPVSGNIVFEISFIWDETRVNGARVNKVALSPATGAMHSFGNSSYDYVHDENMPIFNGTSHRFLWQSTEGRGWTMNIKENLLISHWTEYYNRCTHLPNHMHAFANMLMSPGYIWRDQEFELHTLDVSIKPEGNNYYDTVDVRKVQLPGVTDLWRRAKPEWDFFYSRDLDDQTLNHYPFTYQSETLTRDTWNYYYHRHPSATDRTLDRIYFVAIIEDTLTVKTYRPLYDELDRIQYLPEVINTKTFTLDDRVLSPKEVIALTMRDDKLEVFYPAESGQVCVTLDLVNETTTVKKLGRRVWMSGAYHVRDNIYMFAGTRGNWRDKLGGYIDFDTNGYVETFRFYPSEDSYSHFNTIYPMADSGTGGCPFFDNKTGRIYDIRRGEENYGTRIAVPVDYVAPHMYLHVDTFPERIKKSTEQWRFTYRIEYTGNPAVLELPFDHIHNAEADANLRMCMAHGSDRTPAKAERQEYRHLSQAVSHNRACPTLTGKTFYVDRDVDFYLYLKERENGDFYFIFRYRPSPRHEWVEEEHDIIGWNRAIFDDTSDWRNQYFNCNKPSYYDSSYREDYAPFSREDGLVVRRRAYNNTSYLIETGNFRIHTPDHGEAVDWCHFTVLGTREGFALDDFSIVEGTAVPMGDFENLTLKRNSWKYSKYYHGDGNTGGRLDLPLQDSNGTDVTVSIDLSDYEFDITKVYPVFVRTGGGSAYNPADQANDSSDTDAGHFYQHSSVGQVTHYAVTLAHRSDKGDIVLFEETRDKLTMFEFSVTTS